jgi:hypothetical protein
VMVRRMSGGRRLYGKQPRDAITCSDCGDGLAMSRETGSGKLRKRRTAPRRSSSHNEVNRNRASALTCRHARPKILSSA